VCVCVYVIQPYILYLSFPVTFSSFFTSNQARKKGGMANAHEIEQIVPRSSQRQASVVSRVNVVIGAKQASKNKK
jgi:hypothetical protein